MTVVAPSPPAPRPVMQDEPLIHRRFEETASSVPDAVALVHGQVSWTYGELERRSARLAERLTRLGAGPEVPVAICLERSPELVQAMLAVLRSGGVQVPIDPRYPHARVRFMLRDTGAALVVTTRRLAESLDFGRAHPVCVDDLETAAGERLDPPPGSAAGAGELACVMYTSGSTGTPKGVAVNHRGVLRLAEDEMFRRAGNGDVFMHFAPMTFDAVNIEVWMPLLCGARSVLVDVERPSLAELAGIIEDRRVTHLRLTTGLFHQVVGHHLEALRRVRQLMVGGDVLGVAEARRVGDELPAVMLVNCYGPTENTSFTSCHAARGPSAMGSSVPIGRPIHRTRVYVVGRGLDPVAHGDVGELATGGDGLARGYFGRPGATAERFVPDPFSAIPGERLYLTGDLARFAAGGELEFLGRRDRQVKVRGFRIELGEVETALAGHPRVRQCVAVARDGDAADKVLVAYLVAPRDETDPEDPPGWREYLAARLPDYMVPSFFVELDALPLTPNGKIDRDALPPPTFESSRAWRAPRTRTEEVLAEICARLLGLEALGVEGLGIDDNLFELGAHSLLVTRIAAEIRDRLGSDVPLKVFFEQPTAAGLASWIDAAREEAPAASGLPAIAPVPRDVELPLSFSQERVWFVQQLDPENLAYQFQALLHFTGRLNLAALEAALSEIVRRHESFRTSFPDAGGGRPVQRVHPPSRIVVPVVDLSGLPAERRDAETRRVLGVLASRRFAIDRLPLAGWQAVRLAPERTTVFHLEHHLIHDGWSFNIFLRELALLYAAALEGRPSPLPEPELQFADFTHWHRRWLRGEVLERQLAFWKGELAGCPPVLELPHDRPRPSTQRFRGSSHRMILPESSYHELRDFSHREGVTLYMTMLAAFSTLMTRLSGQDEVCVGSAIANRRFRETENLIGMLVNNVVLRVRHGGEPSYRDLLARVRRVNLEAYSHQDVPFEQVVRALGLPRTLSHNPIFQVMFSFHDSALPAIRLPDLRLKIHDAFSNRSAKFDMNIVVIPRSEQRIGLDAASGEGIIFIWEYDTDLFDATTVARMLEHYRVILAAAVKRPETPVSRLPLLTAAQRRQVADEGNDTAARFPAACLPRRIAERAAVNADAVALVEGDASCTYGELWRRSAAVAAALRRRGVGPDVPVGLFLPRSIDLVVAMLGVLEAGGAYVPLDPSHPRERLGYVLDDVSAAWVVTRGDGLPALPQSPAATFLLDAGPHGGEPRDDVAAAAASVSPGQLAYVIYTSGSTGRPKGVAIPHGAVVNFLDAMLRGPGLTAGDVLCAVTTAAFDISVLEIFLPLVAGARVVIADPATAHDAERLGGLLRRAGVSAMQATPSTWQLLVDEPRAMPAGLRVLCGGEALPGELARRLLGRGAAEVWNLYGPTEATVWAARQRVGEPQAERAVVHIGRPIENLRLYVLDRHLAAVPPGVIGELWLAGRGLARGYRGRPALTAEKFVPDPSARRPGERLYATGDLVRRTAGGTVEFLGRRDHQVKVRGFRIEIGEIEAVLGRHPALEQAVVHTWQPPSGEIRLVAWMVASPGQEPAVEELREFLGRSLPDYMVPAHFVSLERLPLGPTGKVDRKALPAPAGERPRLAQVYEAPRDELETVIARVWSEVLDLEDLGVHDNFFSLGGDSMRSIRLVARLRSEGLHCAVAEIFQHQTVATLAAALRATASARPDVTTAGPALSSGRRPFELVSGADRSRLPEGLDDACPPAALQLGMLFHSDLAPESTVYHNVRSLRLRAPFDAAALRAVLEELVAEHPALRTAFDLGRYSEPLQLVHSRVDVPLAVDDLRELDEPAQERVLDAWFEHQANTPFAIDRPPLIRFHVHRRDDDTFQFGWTEHHAILDGWSVATLRTELLRRYAARLGLAEAPSTPPPALRYSDFVALERQARASETTRRFWQERLAEAPPGWLPHRPGDASAPRRDVRIHHVDVPAGLGSPLEYLAERAGVPLKSVLLAAHFGILGTLTGEDDLVTGLVSHSRLEEAGGERLLGLFLNTLPLRLRLGGSWLELAQATFTAETEMLPHRRLPLADIQRLHGGKPLFETSFNFAHFHVYDDLAGLRGVEILERRYRIETDLALLANFQLDPLRGGLVLRLEHDRSVLGDARVEALGRRYVRTLEALAERPGAPCDARSLTPAERHQVLAAWALGPPLPEGAGAGVLGRFAEILARDPEAVAVRFPGGAWSYRDLELRVEQLAARLREHLSRDGGESVVGLALDAAPETVASLLAVFAAGAAFVPLDPALPAERLAFLVADCGAGVVLTSQRHRQGLPVTGVPVLVLDELLELPARPASVPEREGAAATRVSGEPPGERLAYVIYTSGSTGTPKGCLIEHGSLERYLAWCNRSPLTRRPLPVTTRLGFDAVLKQVLAPLTRGDSVWLIGDPDGDPDALAAALAAGAGEAASDGVAFNGAPAVWQSLLGALEERPASAGRLAGLRALLLGGEGFEDELVERTAALLPEIEIYNLYGPSEATANVSWDRCRPGAPSTLGRPVPGMRFYVCDHRGLPVAPGAPGELLIGGRQLARGYLGRPGLTAAAFVPDLFSGAGGERLYRSGDRVRHLSDGRVQFLGRRDGQIKLRGVRIELGEIEAALAAHPGVLTARVLLVDTGGAPRLAAWVVAAAETAGRPAELPAELRSHLRQRLPDVMVPAAVTVLDALPLTPSGKLDRRALVLPETAERPAWADRVAPRTPLEELLAQTWAQVLGRSSLGVDEDVFELGGHSLNATQVASRLRGLLSLDLPLRILFEHPTIAALAAQIETLRDGGERHRDLPLEPAEVKGPAPLSYAQRRLWFLHRLDPESAAYNLALVFTLDGELDVSALAAALGRIVRRHESLRTVFETVDGEVVQRVLPASTGAVELEVTRAAPQIERELGRRPFDLTAGPLWRFALYAVDDSGHRHRLVLVLHHIIADGWSMGVFRRELALYYRSLGEGPASVAAALPELPITYSDFARWQRRWLESGVLADQLAYWRRRLDGARACELVADRARPAVQSFNGRRLTAGLPDALSRRIEAAGLRCSATPYMILLAAFASVLRRLTGSADLTLGTPIANRNRSEIEGLIGCFVNTLAVRIDAAGQPTFAELVERIRRASLADWAHQDLPFEVLVDELAPQRDLSRTPLFQILFIYQNTPAGNVETPGLSWQVESPDTGTAKFDLSLSVLTSGGRSEALRAGFNSDLYDAATIRRLLDQLRTLLAAAVDAETTPIDELPVLAPAQEHQLVWEWSAGEAVRPAPSATLPERFAAQARRTPDAVALIAGERTWSYGELHRRAEAWSRCLRAHGVGPETRVGLCLERSPEMVIGVLAILAAGGAYVPMPPEYPREMLAHLVSDSRAAVLLTRRALAPVLGDAEAPRVFLDGGPGLPQDAADVACEKPAAEHLAYVIYTSGSTGRPKGIAITHRGVGALLDWSQRRFSDDEIARVFAGTSLSFDLSVWELFVPLTRGGAVIAGGSSLEIAERPCGATLINTVPTAINELLRRDAVPPTVRTVNLAGEALALATVRRLEALPHVERVYNLYGPSEDTTYSTAARVHGDRDVVPIGRAIAGTRARVLDARLRSMPPGVPGDLYLGGAGLARGYLAQAGRTAAVFLPDPYAETPGERMYRTGDLARTLHDGQLDFLGRNDHQVKVRGFRIELSAIETQLGEHPRVREAVVMALGGGAGNGEADGDPARLVAWVVPEGAAAVDAWRAALRERLPEYMVPDVFVTLAALPLLPNGKINRRALPAPSGERPELGTGFAPAETRLERRLTAAWQEVLGLDRVGIDDNFFDVGGNSLLIVRLMDRVTEDLACTLSLVEMFQYPTVRSLAAHLGKRSEAPRDFSHVEERMARQRQARRHRRLRGTVRA